MITFVQVVLIIGALCGGAFAFDLLEKGNNAGGIGSDVLRGCGARTRCHARVEGQEVAWNFYSSG